MSIFEALRSQVTRPRAVAAGIAVASLLVGAGVGYVVRGRGAPARPKPIETATPTRGKAKESEGAKARWWTCAMHPQIRQPKPGRCPICGMALIPIKEGAGEEAASMRRFVTTKAAMELMKIETSPVERKFVTATVRMVGNVTYDETRLAYITAWVPGRIDRLYVDYTGITVRKGDHMVYLYSPELYAAQVELLQALKASKEMGETSVDIVRETTRATVQAAREKLRLLGLTEEQVREIEKRRKATDHITIYAPVGGIVIDKNAQEGMYVQTGTRIYTIADLTWVWVKLEAYESDLQWLRYGQKVTFTTEAYPGEQFVGKISFISPVLDPRTRTVKVRVNVPNEDGRLKPEMFVRAVVHSRVAAGGRVMEPELAGKWMCPMHPEVVEDGPAKCRVCGMPLVRTESLGFVPLEEVETARPLVIPASAPLLTGKRAVVYVQVPNARKPTFEGREIVLGPRAGDYYIVRHGLEEGELVVTRGNFKIDSQLQIMAKPSMMTPSGGGGGMGHHHASAQPRKQAGAPAGGMKVPASFLGQLRKLQAAYARVLGAVEADDLDQARAAFKAFGDALRRVDASALSGHPKMMWGELAMLLSNDSVAGSEAEDMKATGEELAKLKEHFARLREQFGLHGMAAPVATAPEVAADFKAQLRKVLDGYLAAQRALANDDLEGALRAARQASDAVEAVDMKLLRGAAHVAWMRELPALRKAIAETCKGNDIAAVRAGFALVSEEMATLARVFGLAGDTPLYILKCPMAFNNRGARWLQRDKDVRNPYFGATMLKCGEVVGKLGGGGSGPEGAGGENRKPDED